MSASGERRENWQPRMSIHRFKYATPVETAAACAHHILGILEETIAGGGEATFAISGGSTPKLMFEEMSRQRFDWNRVHLYWVDERCVPPTDQQSNFRFAEEYFIVPAHFPRRNIHRVAGELKPEAAAERYIAEVQSQFGLRDGALPHFDMIHCGMGPDSHTASLFPGEPLIEDRRHIAAPVFVEKLNSWRVTLLPGVLLNARHIAMLTAGDDKADAVRAVFEEDYDALKHPSQLVAHGNRSSSWFMDQAAASKLS